jgi:hypothetical protein
MSQLSVLASQVPLTQRCTVQPGSEMAAVIRLPWQSLSRTQSTQPALVQYLSLGQVLVWVQPF